MTSLSTAASLSRHVLNNKNSHYFAVREKREGWKGERNNSEQINILLIKFAFSRHNSSCINNNCVIIIIIIIIITQYKHHE